MFANPISFKSVAVSKRRKITNKIFFAKGLLSKTNDMDHPYMRVVIFYFWSEMGANLAHMLTLTQNFEENSHFLTVHTTNRQYKVVEFGLRNCLSISYPYESRTVQGHRHTALIVHVILYKAIGRVSLLRIVHPNLLQDKTLFWTLVWCCYTHLP